MPTHLFIGLPQKFFHGIDPIVVQKCLADTPEPAFLILPEHLQTGIPDHIFPKLRILGPTGSIRILTAFFPEDLRVLLLHTDDRHLIGPHTVQEFISVRSRHQHDVDLFPLIVSVLLLKTEHFGDIALSCRLHSFPYGRNVRKTKIF